MPSTPNCGTLIDRAELLSKEWYLAHTVVDSIADEFRAYLGTDLKKRGMTVEQFDADLEATVAARRAARVPRANEVSVEAAVATVFASIAPESRLHALRENVEQWVNSWRQRRSAEALSLLHRDFIGCLEPHTVPLQALVDLLGQPDSGTRRDAYWGLSPASGLVLLADQSGMIESMKLN